jgi:hypothetical protein
MKLTLAFTTYNSADYMLKQLEQDYFTMSNGIIDEIVIQDDYTDDYKILLEKQTDNIKVFQNSQHTYPLMSRVNLLNNCKNDWVILMDSDNFLTEKTFNVLGSFTPEPGVIYVPGFAHPGFNFKEQYADTLIDIKLAANRVGQPGLNWLDVLLNTGNFLVPRKEYIEVAKNIDPSLLVHPCEVLYFNFLWLSSGRVLYCNKDYEYIHGLRENSFYRTHCSDPRLPGSIYELYYQYK